MLQNFKSLANILRAKKKVGKSCVLMLGAGASLGSGIPPTNKIMKDLLDLYGSEYTGSLRERFNQLWKRSTRDEKDMFLQPYLNVKPSRGYIHLAHLMKEGIITKVLTTNYDNLLQNALEDIGLRAQKDFLVLVRGESELDNARRLMLETTSPDIKIFKAHGDQYGDYLFDSTEMVSYPKEIGEIFEELTKKDTFVCGYGFQDRCVIVNFSEEGGSIYCVNPSGVPDGLLGIMEKRHSKDWVFDGENGKFDYFFEALHQQLTGPSDFTVATEVTPKSNPYRFLVSYQVCDKDLFFGRENEIKQVMDRLTASPPSVIHVVGPDKSGKTSFAQAGIIANLPANQFSSVYLRCQPRRLELWLPQALAAAARLPQVSQQQHLKEVSKLIAGATKKQVVIIDEFQRAMREYKGSQGESDLVAQLKEFSQCSGDHLRFICVGLADTEFWKAYANVNRSLSATQDCLQDYVEINEFTPEQVANIIQRLAATAGIKFDDDVVQAIVAEYEDKSSKKNPFTLAQVQAICNLLASESNEVHMPAFEEKMRDDGEALAVALNVHDILGFIEDIPDAKRRNLFRNVMKVIQGESKKLLAKYTQEHFKELFVDQEPAEATTVNQGELEVAHV